MLRGEIESADLVLFLMSEIECSDENGCGNGPEQNWVGRDQLNSDLNFRARCNPSQIWYFVGSCNVSV